MAQVPESPQINPEAFKEDEREMVAKIVDPINEYTNLVNEALNQNLTFDENFRGEIKSVRFLEGETTKTFKFTKGKPAALWVVSQRNVTNPSLLNTEVVQAQWKWDGKDNVEITSILGLDVAYRYDITFIIVAK